MCKANEEQCFIIFSISVFGLREMEAGREPGEGRGGGEGGGATKKKKLAANSKLFFFSFFLRPPPPSGSQGRPGSHKPREPLADIGKISIQHCHHAWQPANAIRRKPTKWISQCYSFSRLEWHATKLNFCCSQYKTTLPDMLYVQNSDLTYI